MRKLSGFLPMAALLVGSAAAHAQVVNFNFNSLDPSITGSIEATPLSLTSGGLTASFSSSVDNNGGFIVIQNPSLPFTDDVLITANPTSPGVTLDILFSQPITSFTAVFATDTQPGSPSTLDLTALSGGLGGTIVGTAAATGTFGNNPNYPFPVGQADFSGTAFNAIVLTDVNDPGFAIEDFSVTKASVSSVPEIDPSSGLAAATLLLGGLAVLRSRGSARKPI